MHTTQQGFISLIFVLGISMTLITWIGLSSAQIFTYIHTRKTFQQDRDYVLDLISCADVIIDREIRQYLHGADNEYSVYRNLYFQDPVQCFAFGKQVEVQSLNDQTLLVNVSLGPDHKPFLVVLVSIHNGFVASIKLTFS